MRQNGNYGVKHNKRKEGAIWEIKKKRRNC